MPEQDQARSMSGVELRPGQLVTIAKTHWKSLEPDWIYEGVIISHEKSGDWVVTECAWGRDDADVDGLKFIRGGKIIEYFSSTKRYNVFQVFAPSGEFTGIYANITAPTRFHLGEAGQPVITWEDHWLDVVRLADGTMMVLDEDEYQLSGVPQSDPELDQAIRAALDDLVEQLASGYWDP